MIKEIKGNIINLALDREIDILVHRCNCQGVMGKGLAKEIKKNFPKADKINDKGEKPGTICSVMYPNGLIVVNAYTQIYYGKENANYKSLSPIDNFENELYDTQSNRYKFIRHCMIAVRTHYSDKKIALPLIGCGLAGGDWKTVKQIIDEELCNCDVTIVYFDE